LYTEGIILQKEEISCIVEAPKGEFGIYLVSNNTNMPYRCRIKAPGFLHLQGII
jgi:NADH:ubiquinone oxidoreductase subunit D